VTLLAHLLSCNSCDVRMRCFLFIIILKTLNSYCSESVTPAVRNHIESDCSTFPAFACVCQLCPSSLKSSPLIVSFSSSLEFAGVCFRHFSKYLLDPKATIRRQQTIYSQCVAKIPSSQSCRKHPLGGHSSSSMCTGE